MFINFCGIIAPAEEAIIKADNRAFAYGDSLFETILIRNGNPVFFDAHYYRLLKGADRMRIDMSQTPDKQEVLDMISELLHRNQMSDAVLRWQVFRQGPGLFDAGRTGFVITCRPLPPATPPEGISICIYPDARKSMDTFSPIKHGNYLPYLMGADYARQKNLDDAIILNSMERICDSCIANIFIIHEGNIKTPALSEGCVEGIYRQYLINILRENDRQVDETQLTGEMLLQSDEVFLTNCIRGIIPVRRVDEKVFISEETKKILKIAESHSA